MFDKLCRCTPKNAAKWEKTRAKGKYRYLALWCISYALCAFILEQAIYYLFDPMLFGRALIIDAILWPFAGLFVGILVRTYNERAYKNYLAQTTAS